MSKCEVCGTNNLPGGASSCAMGGDCCICEDCVCSYCELGQMCERHCGCRVCEECGDQFFDSDELEWCDECEENYCQKDLPKHIKEH